MPENIHFDKAPIIEAIIDLRVEPQSGDVMPLLEGLRDTLKGTFPDSHNMLEVAVQIDDVSGSHTQSINGYRLFSEDKQKVIQIRRDGFGLAYCTPTTGGMDFVMKPVASGICIVMLFSL